MTNRETQPELGTIPETQPELGTIPHELKPDITNRETEFAGHVIMCLANGKVPSKSAAAQRMMLSLSTVERKEYQGLNIEEKKSYRKRWIEMNLLPKYTVTRTENEAWKNIDTTKGEYLSATKYWEEEGGSEYDFEATAKALQNVLQWVHLGYGTTA